MMTHWNQQLNNLHCRNCGYKPINLPHNAAECVCDICFEKLPRILCKLCGKAYSKLDYTNHCGDRVDCCWKCNISFRLYGEPKECKICASKAAFGDDQYCRHCSTSVKKFGMELKKCNICNVNKAWVNICYHCIQQTLVPFPEPPKKKQRLSNDGNSKPF